MSEFIFQPNNEKILFESIKDRNEKFNRNYDLIERCYGNLKRCHRVCFDYFRKHGIFLPMTSCNA